MYPSEICAQFPLISVILHKILLKIHRPWIVRKFKPFYKRHMRITLRKLKRRNRAISDNYSCSYNHQPVHFIFVDLGKAEQDLAIFFVTFFGPLRSAGN